MKFTVYAANKETGQEVIQEVEANSAENATALVNGRGFLVSSVERPQLAEVKTPKWPYVAIVALTISLIVCYWVKNSQVQDIKMDLTAESMKNISASLKLQQEIDKNAKLCKKANQVLVNTRKFLESTGDAIKEKESMIRNMKRTITKSSRASASFVSDFPDSMGDTQKTLGLIMKYKNTMEEVSADCGSYVDKYNENDKYISEMMDRTGDEMKKSVDEFSEFAYDNH